MSTEFPSGGKLAQKSIKPSEVNKDVEVLDLREGHQDSITTSVASQADRNHETP